MTHVQPPAFDEKYEAIMAQRKKALSAYRRREVIGNATLYLGDCLEILRTLAKVDGGDY